MGTNPSASPRLRVRPALGLKRDSRGGAEGRQRRGAIDPTPQNMIQKDATTNVPDTNLANGM